MLCIALVFLAAVVVASDDGAEVVDLGRLGENTGRRGKASTIRRGGSFLSTEGSFTMSQGRFQGNNEEDELGERDASSEDAYGQTDIDELGDSEEHEQADELGYSNQLGEELTVRDHVREKKFSAGRAQQCEGAPRTHRLAKDQTAAGHREGTEGETCLDRVKEYEEASF